MGKKKKDTMEKILDSLFGVGHDNNKRRSNWDKHSGAKRNQGSGRPNTKSSVRERHNKNS